MQSLIQTNQKSCDTYNCQKPSSIGWMWQYMYKAFIARYDMCSLKVMYKALKDSSEVIQTTECILILFLLHRMTLLT